MLIIGILLGLPWLSMIARVILFELAHQNSRNFKWKYYKNFNQFEMVSKDRSLIFSIKLHPYSKLNPVEKVTIPWCRQQTKAFEEPLLHFPLYSGRALPPWVSYPLHDRTKMRARFWYFKG